MRIVPFSNSSLLPLACLRLAAPALLVGALASGCSAGNVDDAPSYEDAPSASGSPLPSPPATTQGSNAAAPPISDTPAVASGDAPAQPAADVDAEGAAPLPSEEAGDDADVAGDPNVDDDDDDDRDDAAGDDDRDDDGGDDDGDDPDDDDDDGDDDDDDDRDDDGGGDDDDGGGDDDDDGGDDDGAGATPPAEPPPSPTDALTFTADIRPILLESCGRCHASGGLPNFASADAGLGYDVAFRERNDIVEEIQSGNMPADTCNGAPGSNGCVSVADFDLIRQWVAAGAPE